MRLRSTRLSAISPGAAGPLSVTALFGAQSGRKGFYYGESYDECLRINNAAVAAGRPQDCVLFDDPAGTVPVLSALQTTRGRGLLLDRSQGLARGPELFSDGATTFSGASSRVSSGVYRVYSPDGSYSLVGILNAGAVAGRWYEVSFNVDSVSIPGNGLQIESAAVVPTIAATVGPKRVLVRAGSTSLGIKRSSTPTDIQISAVSVRELPGNHMTQPTAAARGEISRRYNRLESSEDLRPTFWTKVRATPVTASRVEATETNTNGFLINRNSGATTGSSSTFAVRISRGNRDWCCVLIWDVSSNGVRQWINTATGELGAVTTLGSGFSWSGVSVVAVGDGAFDLRLTANHPAGSTIGVQVYPATSGNGAFNCTLGDWAELTRFDLRFSADAIPSIPAYQRVTSSTDYDEVGFPAYWRGQTDDWAYADVDPAGATKVLVMWAGQKMSEITNQVILEGSNSSSTATGVVALFGSPGGSSAYAFRSKGTSGGDSAPPSGTSPAPNRHAVRAYGDISSDTNTQHANGALVASQTADQGTGAYTAQRYYFGARAGTSLFVNEREPVPPMALFMQPADPGLSAAQIALLDRLYAKAVGAAI